ncbi:MAG TPA: acyl-CoA dehydrogenase family protein [Kofleriaceae bacterium]|jgi:alkylation response protein AidB-like acyl-CoA dehydrogenase|nr:acyl-CoA dehydrogenase family protein [Kofleriaceae bacterium]
MDFGLDDEQTMIVQTIRRFTDRDLRAWAADADRAGAAPEKLAATAGEMGFFLDAVPADAGGLLEGAYSHTTRALRGFELGRGCAAMAALLEANVEPSLAVAKWGDDAAKKAVFAALEGGGLATTWRDARGSLSIDGDRVTGKIGPAPALARASFVLVIADGLVTILPVGGAKALDPAPTSWRACAWGTMQVDGLSGFTLARGGAAPAVSEEILSWWKTSLAARAAGVAAAAMEHADKYGRERVQFGQPIGKFESLIRLRDDAETGSAAARLMALHAAWAIDHGRSATAAHDAASRARAFAGDVVAKATIDAVQILGGYGFVNDYPVEKLMRDARGFDAVVGDERLDRALAIKATIGAEA